MESFDEAEDSASQALNDVINRNHQNLRFSNFLITLSTNVVPETDAEAGALAQWLRDESNNLFADWARLNGTVLKPAGSPNDSNLNLGDNHQVVSCRSRVSLESGEQKGQYHAHVVLEVAHTYTDKNSYGNSGVHINVAALREYLNGQIYLMGIAPQRMPEKIYVNSRLLTKQTDNSAKWLTLQYINKTRDKNGLNLASQRRGGTEEERSIHQAMKNPVEEFEALVMQDSPPRRASPDADINFPDSPSAAGEDSIRRVQAARAARANRARYEVQPVPPQMVSTTSMANAGSRQMRMGRAKPPTKFKPG